MTYFICSWYQSLPSRLLLFTTLTFFCWFSHFLLQSNQSISFEWYFFIGSGAVCSSWWSFMGRNVLCLECKMGDDCRMWFNWGTFDVSWSKAFSKFVFSFILYLLALRYCTLVFGKIQKAWSITFFYFESDSVHQMQSKIGFTLKTIYSTENVAIGITITWFLYLWVASSHLNLSSFRQIAKRCQWNTVTWFHGTLSTRQVHLFYNIQTTMHRLTIITHL